MGPDVRESRPRKTGFPSCVFFRKAPNPAARMVTSSGVRGWPTIPLNPETLTMSSGGKTTGIVQTPIGGKRNVTPGAWIGYGVILVHEAGSLAWKS
jgi:hypothetical protein